MITHAQFQQYTADGFTLVPIVREVLSDLDTPLSVYLKLADGPHTYLFESVEGGERFGRYSIIGLAARCLEGCVQAGDTVLDPFCGSGSTGVAAREYGCRFVGIDTDEHALEGARTRLRPPGVSGQR